MLFLLVVGSFQIHKKGYASWYLLVLENSRSYYMEKQ